MKTFVKRLAMLALVFSLTPVVAFHPRLEIFPAQDLPDFTFMDPQGLPTTLKECLKQNTEENKGKVIVLNFWSITCGPCLAEMPALDQLSGYYNEKDLMVIPVNVDPIRQVGLENFYQENRYRYLNIYQDPKRTSQEIFKWNALPTTLLINRDGKMVGRLIGQAKWDSPEALAMFDQMIKGQDPQKAEPNLLDKIKDLLGLGAKQKITEK